MDITYPGPHGRILVPALDREVERGETVLDVADDIAAALLAQGWTADPSCSPADVSCSTSATRTVAEVKAAVGDDLAKAHRALAVETGPDGRGRRSLVAHLEAVIETAAKAAQAADNPPGVAGSTSTKEND